MFQSASFIKLREQLHYLYLLYAIPMVYLAATLIPPFQNPDEPNHLMRAEQVSRLELVPVFKYDTVANSQEVRSADPTVLYPDEGGFKVDKGILSAASIFLPIQSHPEVKVNAGMINQAKAIKWGGGYTYSNFGNTAIYVPVVYAMPALGIVIGKVMHLSVIKTIFISRLFNALLAITISFFALMLAKRSNLVLFIVLLFPMTIELFASVSQDAVLISCAFLLVAVLDHAQFNEKPQYQTWHIVTLIILMCVIGMAKPPYALLAIVFLFLQVSVRTKVLLLSIPFLVVALWLYVDHANLSIIFAPPAIHVNAKLQVSHILHQPIRFIGLFFKADWKAILTIAKQFLGSLGWLDAGFSLLYYIIAFCVLLFGFIVNFKFDRKELKPVRLALIGGVFITLLAVITVQYITWTPLYSPVLNGMQGRYFLPIFPFLALALSRSTILLRYPAAKLVMCFLVLAFPLFTAISLMESLISRYYPHF